MAIMDTHEAFKLLQSAGLDEEKAEAIVRGGRGARRPCDQGRHGSIGANG